MKLTRLRPTELLELLALLGGVSLILYFSCREEPLAPAARDSKVFAAPRAGAAITSPGSNESTRAATEQALERLLARVATGEVTEAQRSEVQQSLVALLERSERGTAESRVTATAMIVQQVFDQAKLQVASPELSLRQQRAIASMAQELTRQLMLMATGSSPGADGIEVALPPDHERVTWNQLGGFAYREGEPLPEELRALGGRKVGIPGFMLTLGDPEAVREFILVESLWGCCFGSVPELNQTIVVRIKAGQSAEHTATPLLVTGVLEVGEEREGGFVTSVYRLTDASVAHLATELAP
jgi:hypothetical protein